MALEFLDLKKVRKEDPAVFNKTVDWTKTLTKELDSEEGSSFTNFIKRNLDLEYPYGVFILYDTTLNEVVGITSIVLDDQDVGKENDIEGLWIAGVNVRREFRNKGYGKLLFKNIDNYLSKLGSSSLRVNLFVSNPHALKIYEQVGFKQIGLKVVRGGKESTVCSKHYNE